MFKIFCSVYAYDHTIKAGPRRGRNISFFKTGLGIGTNLKRLETIMKENNHTNTVIEYLKVLCSTCYLWYQTWLFMLKVDIEWGEFQTGGFSDWFSSGALQNVNQLGINCTTWSRLGINISFSHRASSSKKYSQRVNCDYNTLHWSLNNDNSGTSTCWRSFRRCSN